MSKLEEKLEQYEALTKLVNLRQEHSSKLISALRKALKQRNREMTGRYGYTLGANLEEALDAEILQILEGEE